MGTMRHNDLPVDLNALTGEILGAAIQVHRTLGPGLLERVYRVALARELGIRGRRVDVEVPVSAKYAGQDIGIAFRIDLLVDRRVVIELKAVESILPVHKAQVITYLKLGDYPVGLLINFHAATVAEATHRLLNPHLARPSLP